jgi:hypothetical protein
MIHEQYSRIFVEEIGQHVGVSGRTRPGKERLQKIVRMLMGLIK